MLEGEGRHDQKAALGSILKSYLSFPNRKGLICSDSISQDLCLSVYHPANSKIETTMGGQIRLEALSSTKANH